MRHAAALHLVCAIDRLALQGYNKAGRVRTKVIADPAQKPYLPGDEGLLLR